MAEWVATETAGMAESDAPGMIGQVFIASRDVFRFDQFLVIDRCHVFDAELGDRIIILCPGRVPGSGW